MFQLFKLYLLTQIKGLNEDNIQWNLPTPEQMGSDGELCSWYLYVYYNLFDELLLIDFTTLQKLQSCLNYIYYFCHSKQFSKVFEVVEYKLLTKNKKQKNKNYDWYHWKANNPKNTVDNYVPKIEWKK